jgi:hypothetical protein
MTDAAVHAAALADPDAQPLPEATLARPPQRRRTLKDRNAVARDIRAQAGLLNRLR